MYGEAYPGSGQHHDYEQEGRGQGDWPPEGRELVDQPEAQQGEQEVDPLVASGLASEEDLPATARSRSEGEPGPDGYDAYLGTLGVPGTTGNDEAQGLTLEGTGAGKTDAIKEILLALEEADEPMLVIDPDGEVLQLAPDSGSEVVLDLTNGRELFGAAVLEALARGELDPGVAERIIVEFLKGDGAEGVQPPTTDAASDT